MRKKHHAKLKFHAFFSIAIATILLTLLIFIRDIALGLATTLLLLYIAGNGIIHSKSNVLHRDSIVEYGIVSLVILTVLAGVLF